MRITVAIPAYNSAGFIQATLDSVLRQTRPADEILVLDDGSTDDTLAVLGAYGGQITVIPHKNGGVARARNELCRRAGGDLIAFLDHDDLWHPDYLRAHSLLWTKHPDIVASFVGHVDFHGLGGHAWTGNPLAAEPGIERLNPIGFLNAYNERTGQFGSASFLCVSKAAVRRAGEKPFSEEFSGVDDSYLATILPLLGSVLFCPAPLAAYRITEQAQSHNKLKALEMWARVFEVLEPRYRAEGSPELHRAFLGHYASKRRHYAKRLMGAGKPSEARAEIWRSLFTCWSPRSQIKSLSLLAATFLPSVFQPHWPAPYREASGTNR